MNKSIILLSVLALTAGMAFANGNGDSSDLDRPGLNRIEEVEIVSLDGAVTKDSYGNLIIEEGKKNYVVRMAPTLDADLNEGDVLDGEGVAGRTLYTKDGEDYIEFHITMLTVDGETLAIDMDSFYGGKTGWGTTGRDSMTRGSMRGGMNRDSQDRRTSDRNDYNRDGIGSDMWGRDSDRGLDSRGMIGALPADGEEITLSGTITLYDEYHPLISFDGKNYALMLGRYHYDEMELTEGMTAKVTGYEGRTLYTEEGEEYYSFMVTSAVIDGEEVELDHMFPGEDRDSRRGGMMPGRRS